MPATQPPPHSWPRIWPIVAVLAFLALFVGYLWYTRALIDDIRQDTERLATLYARALRVTSPEEAQLLVFEEVVQNFPYPVIMTDEQGSPTAFRNLPELDVESPTPPWSPAERLELRQEAARMDRMAAPYPVTDENGEVVQRIHVAEAGTIRLLRYLPWIQAAGLAAIGLLAFWLIRYNLRVQRGQIWVSMARESAHQLGTPLSSMYGWIELLRLERAAVAAGGAPDDESESSEIDVDAALSSMEQDLDRLTKVANRFELIGTTPQLAALDPREVVGEVERYYRARLPRRGRRIDLVTRAEPVPPVMANRTLVEWALENLVKNSIDALEGRGGRIEIEVGPGPMEGTVKIEVTDDGPGVPWTLRKRIFEPGVSTKSRGWGVGLSLTRRILEEYHDGSLELLQREPDTGATFRMTLPAAEPEEDERA